MKPTNMKQLPKYVDCQYSLFISYAHQDDIGNNRFVSKLDEAIYERLIGGVRDIPTYKLHLSAKNGPVAGLLSEELKDRIKESFGMLLVVGERYVDSDWCKEELEFFYEIFGESGVASRLYIVAMTENALNKVSSETWWKKIVRPEQIWIRMYEDSDSENPMKPGLGGKQGYNEDFVDQVKKIADPLIEKIKEDWQASKTITETSSTGMIEEQQKKSLQIAISPTTSPELDAYVQALSDHLEKAGKTEKAKAECFHIPKELIEQYDPDDKKNSEELRKYLQKADVLIVPFWEVTPLCPANKPGGHLGILDDEWRNLKKEKNILWYKPQEISGLNAPVQKHIDFFRNLSPLCQSENALLSLLFGQQKGEEIKIFIENHPTVKVYEALIEKIEEIWEQVNSGGTDRAPRIRCEPLDLDHLEDVPKDASGIVLICPVGLKPYESLQQQISRVQNEIFIPGASYPGRVALVFRPESEQGSPLGMMSWNSVKCNQLSEKFIELDLIPEGEAELKMFLEKLLKSFNKKKMLVS